MFATGSLARRIEAAEASLIHEAATGAARRTPPGQAFSIALRGATAAYAEPGSPLNKVAGLGFGGVPDGDELTALERAYDERACPVQVELATFADPAIGKMLTRRGYELVGYENVSGLALDSTTRHDAAMPDGIDIVRVTEAESEDWLETVLTGFHHPDVFDGVASHETFDQEVARRSVQDMTTVSGFDRYLARRAGVVAGGASFRTFSQVAQLCGSATLPEHRRRGVQSALLRHRLAEAARRGCDVAVVTTQPGSKSQENVERSGFTLLYVRAVLIRDGASRAGASEPPD